MTELTLSIRAVRRQLEWKGTCELVDLERMDVEMLEAFFGLLDQRENRFEVHCVVAKLVLNVTGKVHKYFVGHAALRLAHLSMI